MLIAPGRSTEAARKFLLVSFVVIFGGISIGFGSAGLHLELANDISDQAVSTLKHNLHITHSNTSTSRVVSSDIKELYKFLDLNKVSNSTESLLTIETLKEKVSSYSAKTNRRALPVSGR